MTIDDRDRWNGRYREAASAPKPSAPTGFLDVVDMFPAAGSALDIACGVGAGSVWLALRGLVVSAVDGSDVAIDRARELAALHGVAERCRFEVFDLDEGIPAGTPVELLTCHLFSAPALDEAMRARLVPGGVLAITVLSEVGASPGPFRARPGELLERFSTLELLHHREGEGSATLVGRAAGPQPVRRLD